ncbi:heat shock protein 75 kDa, mitochondrial-like [Mizuhopecten yessoensis]|uniref:Heat shock protein 75 kDa, mitochondrial n=1 Tax=Mizuhopecten yessoensis TaxID=6573 RepID=A0A210QVV8_MIZYE|nr:heat shock protein 75 kDa, mitochondrial-like [Mizuhopecten yessoensis]OWF52890.1 Heat shock protein 75 kDa, mitochondrial [Mizuhopecten yessoensis]
MAASMRTCVFRDLRLLHRSLLCNPVKSYPLPRCIHLTQKGGRQCLVPIYQVSRPRVWTGGHRSFVTSASLLSSEPETIQGEIIEEEVKEEETYHSIIKDTERSTGPGDKLEFQAETRKLLDIVARSLYSEREVFIRELISNSSDALEKMRYMEMSGDTQGDPALPLEIHLAADDSKKTFTIQDTGIGMTKEEMIGNLGTIARSGSKAFLESVNSNESKSDVSNNIIGQFGVGFYSSFMVADKVEVYSRSHQPDAVGYKWTTDGTGMFEIAEAEGVQRGTKIVLHLKGDCYNYSNEEVIKEVVKRYSNFVGVPIFLNGKRANVVQALWLADQKDITADMHEEFYRYIGNVYDKPRYHLHYKTDAPLNIRALFYVPEYKPTMFDMSRETDVCVTLYSRKVMIMSRASNILPRWLRFLKGVVDSEDIPLNLSRELLQDSSLIRKLRQVLTSRILKFFQDCAKKDVASYAAFYDDYGLFFREGIVTEHDQDTREEIAKLLRFESSKSSKGDRISLNEYASRMKAGSRDIYFLSAPNRELAEQSPYLEALEKRDVEVLFLYEPYDELVLMNLGQYDKKFFKSIENEMTSDKTDTDTVDESDVNSLRQTEVDDLMTWLQGVLGNKVTKVKVTKKLVSHACVITVPEMGSVRHFLRTTLADKSEEERYRVLHATLEINPSHPLIKKVYDLKNNKADLGRLVAEQLFDNAMINAGLLDDPRTMVGRVNEILEKALL